MTVPQDANQRIDDLDYLRGFALMGILLVNIPVLSRNAIPVSGSASEFIFQFFDYFVQERFFVIFSFLFGVGFFLFIHRAEAKGQNGLLLYSRRLLVLLVFGIIHQWVYPGEALLFYAVIGFLLLPFYRLRPTFILVAALLTMIAGILLSQFINILAMFLLGLYVGRIGLFVKTERYQLPLRLIWLGSLLLALPALYIQNLLNATNNYGVAHRAAGIVLATLYVTTLIFALRHQWIRRLLSPLKAYGRIALTNYIGQTVIILTIVHAFHLFTTLTYVQTTLICGGIYVFQMVYSVLWLQLFRMGPLEWIWRIATYWKVLPLKRENLAVE